MKSRTWRTTGLIVSSCALLATALTMPGPTPLIVICIGVQVAGLAVVFFHINDSANNNVLQLQKAPEPNPPGKELSVLPTAPAADHEIMHDTISRSITANNQESRRFIESMPIGLLTLDSEGRVRTANLRALLIFRTTITKIKGKSVESLLLPMDPPGEGISLAALRATGGALTEARAISFTAEATLVPVDLAIGPLTLPKEEGFILSLTDMSQRYELERIKQEFLEIVSHDLRTPLTSLAIYFHAMLEQSEDDEDEEQPVRLSDPDRQMTLVAQSTVSRLMRLVNSLLDANMMRSGKLKLQKTSAPGDSSLVEVMTALSQLCLEKKLSLNTRIDTGEFVADHARLSQVLENLIGNAIKYSPQGGEITVTGSRTESRIRFTIQDRGRGIAPEHAQRLFERFQQVESSDQVGQKGFGLGLSICKMIVNAHGGTIGVDSEPGKGSCFWFELPLEENLASANERLP
jgi:signal transduction histidine kinase